MSHSNLEKSILGKKTEYVSHYDPQLLFPIARKINRDAIGVSEPLPFIGFDIWNHYEVSWLNEKGKPIAALAEIIFNCSSQNIIESKSMKLYFNSLNNTSFKDTDSVQALIAKDLREKLQTSFIRVRLIPLAHVREEKLHPMFVGTCIDDLDIDCSVYHNHPDFLQTENDEATEILHSNLLKSNCLVTNQPDWCSVQISYTGNKINHEGLLRYIVSFRDDNEFHEQCIEKIFMQIRERCSPRKLTVYGRSTRRGGLDINSLRSTEITAVEDILNMRLCRQ